MTIPAAVLSRHLSALAHFAVEGRHTTVPEKVERFGRLLLLDTLGALVGGTRYPAVRCLRERGSEAQLGGPDLPFAPLFRLGTAATWLDADSGGSFHPQGHRLPPVPTAHPAPHVLPVLLHGAARGTDDEELVRVFLLATEIGMRFGTATSLRPGMHPHGIHGPVAAAVAASLLLGHAPALLEAAMAQALATPMAARLRVPMGGGTVRNAWTGLGGYYGARAAAEAGHRPRLAAGAAASALDTVVTPDAQPELLTDSLGERWAVLDSYLKPYACARWIHPALDAAAAALASRPDRTVLDPVERVDVETFAFAASLSAVDVRSDLHARFSLPVCLATLLLDRELHAAAFLPDRLARAGVRALAAAVRVRENEELTAALPGERPATVTITWRDGARASHHVRQARGNPSDPLRVPDVAVKFRANVDTVLPLALAEQCLSAFTEERAHGRVLRAVATLLV